MLGWHLIRGWGLGFTYNGCSRIAIWSHGYILMNAGNLFVFSANQIVHNIRLDTDHGVRNLVVVGGYIYAGDSANQLVRYPTAQFLEKEITKLDFQIISKQVAFFSTWDSTLYARDTGSNVSKWRLKNTRASLISTKSSLGQGELPDVWVPERMAAGSDFVITASSYRRELRTDDTPRGLIKLLDSNLRLSDSYVMSGEEFRLLKFFASMRTFVRKKVDFCIFVHCKDLAMQACLMAVHSRRLHLVPVESEIDRCTDIVVSRDAAIIVGGRALFCIPLNI